MWQQLCLRLSFKETMVGNTQWPPLLSCEYFKVFAVYLNSRARHRGRICKPGSGLWEANVLLQDFKGSVCKYFINNINKIIFLMNDFNMIVFCTMLNILPQYSVFNTVKFTLCFWLCFFTCSVLILFYFLFYFICRMLLFYLQIVQNRVG